MGSVLEAKLACGRVVSCVTRAAFSQKLSSLTGAMLLACHVYGRLSALDHRNRTHVEPIAVGAAKQNNKQCLELAKNSSFNCDPNYRYKNIKILRERVL